MRTSTGLLGLLASCVSLSGSVFTFPEKSANQEDETVKEYFNVEDYKCSDYDFDFDSAGGGVISVIRHKNVSDTDNSTQESSSLVEEETTRTKIEDCTITKEDCKTVDETICQDEDKEYCEETVEKTCHPAGNETKIGGICVEKVIKDCKTIPEEVCKTVPRQVCEEIEVKQCSQSPYLTGYGGPNPAYGEYPYIPKIYKISYNYLFFPWVQTYRAPNVVREKESESDETIDRLEEIPEGNDTLDDIFTQAANLNRFHLSDLPGCYPLVTPLLETLSSFLGNLITQDDSREILKQLVQQEKSTEDVLNALELYEPQISNQSAAFNEFQSYFDYSTEANLAMMLGGHEYKETTVFQLFSQIGSYMGLSFGKDFKIAKCEMQQAIPDSWADYKEFIANYSQTLSDKTFKFENLTVDDIFFSYEDACLTVGDYNVTDIIEDYNVSAVMYSVVENLDPVVTTVAEYKNELSRTLGLGNYETEATDPTVILISSPLENNMLEEYRDMKQKIASRSYSRYFKKEHKQAVNCEEVNSTNVQECWESMINEMFESVDPKVINESFQYVDIALITFLTQFHLYITIGLGFLVGMLLGVREYFISHLPCVYDIIQSQNVLSDREGIRDNGDTFLQTVISSFDREEFTDLPIVFVDSIEVIVSHDNLTSGLFNITQAAISKLSSIVSEGDLAGRVVDRASDLRQWLLTVDILDVLEQFTSLVLMITRYGWSWYAGEWPELVSLMDSLVSWMEGEIFWERLSPLMKQAMLGRWNIMEYLVEEYFSPAIKSTVHFLQWLAEDVEGNLLEIAQHIRDCDGVEYLWGYYGWLYGQVGEYFICRDSTDGESYSVFFYMRMIQLLHYLEPSFLVFEGENLCQIFDVCPSDGDPNQLSQKIQDSGVTEAITNIHNQIFKLKRAVICRPPEDVDKSYWEHILV